MSKIDRFQILATEHLGAIAGLLREDAQIALVVSFSGEPEMDIVMSRHDARLLETSEALARRMAASAEGKQ
jgi:hypothetical protein